jgi:hypothetical protein
MQDLLIGKESAPFYESGRLAPFPPLAMRATARRLKFDVFFPV